MRRHSNAKFEHLNFEFGGDDPALANGADGSNITAGTPTVDAVSADADEAAMLYFLAEAASSAHSRDTDAMEYDNADRGGDPAQADEHGVEGR